MILGTKENNINDLRGYENNYLYPYVEFINVIPIQLPIIFLGKVVGI